MAGRTFEPTKRGARDLNRFIRKGTTVYTVRKIAKNIAKYEDDELYAAHTFDWRSPITGNWMTSHLSAEGLLAQEGTVYEKPPTGMREIGRPGPQVGGPIPADETFSLSEASIRGFEKYVADMPDPKKRWGR